MKARTLLAGVPGASLLVFFGARAAKLTFGFKLTGASTAAGVLLTALVFGLVLLVLAYRHGAVRSSPTTDYKI